MNAYALQNRAGNWIVIVAPDTSTAIDIAMLMKFARKRGNIRPCAYSDCVPNLTSLTTAGVVTIQSNGDFIYRYRLYFHGSDPVMVKVS